jgi:enolase
MARIVDVHARRVWDSRGRPTVEAEVILKGARGRAIAPAGASTGSFEAKELRDGGEALGGMDVAQAVQNVNTLIRTALLGVDARDQQAVDEKLIALDGTPDKSRLGANATVAVSLACAHASRRRPGARCGGISRATARSRCPCRRIQIYGGGAHARGRVDIQDYLIICTGAGSFAESLEWASEVYRAAGARLAKKGALQGVADEGGYWPSFNRTRKASPSLPVRSATQGSSPATRSPSRSTSPATQFYRRGTYHLALENRSLTSEELHAMLLAGSSATRSSRSRTRSRSATPSRCARSPARPGRACRSSATISSRRAPSA